MIVKKIVLLFIVLIILACIIKFISVIVLSSPMAYTIQYDMNFRTNQMYEFNNRYSKSDSLLIDSLLLSILKSRDNFKFVDIDTNMEAKDDDTEEDIERKIILQYEEDWKRMKNPVKTYNVHVYKEYKFLFYEKISHTMRYNSIDGYKRSCYFFNFNFFIVPVVCIREWAA